MKTLRFVFFAVLAALGSSCGSVPGLTSLLDDGKADLIPLPAALHSRFFPIQPIR